MTKICSSCSLEKPTTAFGKNAALKDKLMSSCKDCVNARGRAAYNSDLARKHKHLKRYGLTLDEVVAMAEKQNYLCLICEKQCAFLVNNGANAFHVDHCHTTGRIRGLICATCNRGLGLFYDNPELLRKAADYLG
jgi:hypothetical protein